MSTHLHFILVRRIPPVPSPVLVEVSERLQQRGFVVTAGIPEEELTRVDEPGDDHDLFILKSHTELALSLAGALHGEGMRLLNPYQSCTATQDKVVTCRRLQAAGVPVPPTWVTADPALVHALLERGPLVVKPVRGHRGAGVVVVRRPEDLAAVARPAPDAPVVVQDHVPGPGEDLKVYVVGQEVHAVRKPFAADSFTRPGRPVPVTEAVRSIALRCGDALGLGLYGLDVIEADIGPVVVDVNYFPGYKGAPGAAGQIAGYIEAYALGRVGLSPGGVGAVEPAPA